MLSTLPVCYYSTSTLDYLFRNTRVVEVKTWFWNSVFQSFLCRSSEHEYSLAWIVLSLHRRCHAHFKHGTPVFSENRSFKLENTSWHLFFHRKQVLKKKRKQVFAKIRVVKLQERPNTEGSGKVANLVTKLCRINGGKSQTSGTPWSKSWFDVYEH